MCQPRRHPHVPCPCFDGLAVTNRTRASRHNGGMANWRCSRARFHAGATAEALAAQPTWSMEPFIRSCATMRAAIFSACSKTTQSAGGRDNRQSAKRSLTCIDKTNEQTNDTPSASKEYMRSSRRITWPLQDARGYS